MNKNNQLQELQSCELDLLKQLIKVCDKLNINYYLIGGTLIGAVRHKGFIPWDDDIDVCMMRKDYELFVKECQKHFDDSKYFLQTYDTDNEYPCCFAKLRNSNTTFIESSIKHCNINHGVYIDIFPLDNYYKINKKKEKMIKYAILFNYYKQSNNLIKKFLAYISKIMYFRFDQKKLCKKLDNMYKKHNNVDSQKVVNYNGAWGIEKECHDISCFSEYILMDFEDIKVKVPVGYDKMLTTTYGDYMKLPPKEKQVSHHYTDIIDLKKSYKNYTQERKLK